MTILFCRYLWKCHHFVHDCAIYFQSELCGKWDWAHTHTHKQITVVRIFNNMPMPITIYFEIMHYTINCSGQMKFLLYMLRYAIYAQFSCKLHFFFIHTRRCPQIRGLLAVTKWVVGIRNWINPSLYLLFVFFVFLTLI